mgnify:CR=1 FL=1
MERTRKIMEKVIRKLLHNSNICFKGYIRDDEVFDITNLINLNDFL